MKWLSGPLEAWDSRNDTRYSIWGNFWNFWSETLHMGVLGVGISFLKSIYFTGLNIGVRNLWRSGLLAVRNLWRLGPPSISTAVDPFQSLSSLWLLPKLNHRTVPPWVSTATLSNSGEHGGTAIILSANISTCKVSLIERCKDWHTPSNSTWLDATSC